MDFKNKLVVAGLILMGLSPSAHPETRDLAGRAPVRIGIARQLSSSVALLAAHQNYFAEQGLSVDIRYEVSGKRVLQELIAGNIDIAMGVSEVPFVFESLKNEPLTILAAIGGDDKTRKIVARRSAGILKPEDLAGKRVATQEKSAVHFFLHVFLNSIGMSEADVRLSFMKAEELAGALADGRIDAFSMREPYISEARRLLGEDMVVFEMPHVYFSYEMIVVRPSFLKSHRYALIKALRAVEKASAWRVSNPKAATAIVARSLGMEPAEVFEQSQGIRKELFLNKGLVTTLEDVARWGVAMGSEPVPRIPAYDQMIDNRILKKIKPSLDY